MNQMFPHLCSMKPLVRHYLIPIIQAIIFGNWYIAMCAVVMSWTTARLFHLHLPDSLFYFIFVGTLSSYSLHEYLTDCSATGTDRERWIQAHKPGLLCLFSSSLLIGIGLMTQLRAHLSELLPVVFLTFLYTAPKMNWPPFRALRRIAVLKTTYLALVWTYVTVALPLLLSNPGVVANYELATVWFVNRLLLIYSVALCFDYRDRAVDRHSKWLTIVSMLTQQQVRLFFRIIALGFGLTLAALYSLGWNGYTLLCICLPMFLLQLGVPRIMKQESDYGYYVILDGLLMLSGILLDIAPGRF